MPGIQDTPGTLYAHAYIPGQATAGSTDSWPVFVAPGAVTITSIDWTPAAAVTGDNSNYYSAAFQNKGQAGAGTTAVTSTKAYTTGTDSVAHDTEAFTLSATTANLNLASGDVLAMVRTITGTGLAQPDGIVRIGYKYR